MHDVLKSAEDETTFTPPIAPEDWPRHVYDVGTPGIGTAICSTTSNTVYNDGPAGPHFPPIIQTIPRYYNWFPSRKSDRSDYRIAFYWPRRVERPSSFVFVFYNSSTNLFTEKEWCLFFEWKREHLPAVFPGSSMEVTQHPAEQTAAEDRKKISEATGFPLPKRYRKGS